jgi:hypothetical protein
VDVRRTYSGWKILKFSSIQIPEVINPPITFSEYCHSLDRWEQLLLSNVTLLFDPRDIIDKLSRTSFRAVSDGSAIANQGTFGWVLALKEKTRLAYASGPVEGHDPQSFRSEAQGMLSIVCFLSRLKVWTQSTLALRGILATDNTGLVDCVHEQTTIRYPVPASTLKPDWDLVEAIVAQVAQANLQVKYKHVKGHQDNDTLYESLPFLAQLNVDADKYAGEYQRRHGSYRPLISLSPTRPIALDINGKTIHRNMKTAFQDSAHAAPLLDRLCRRNLWSTDIIKTIDWDAHRLSTSVHRTRRTHFVKLFHEYLPSGKIAHRNNPTHPDFCPLCKSPSEDHQHILRCAHVSREKWREEFLSTLSKKCDVLQTDPILKSILINGARCWLRVAPFDEGGIPSSYHSLLASQRNIGWYQIFLARMSIEWSHLQSQFLQTLELSDTHLTGDKWTAAICTVVTTSWLDLWDARNKDRHGDESSEKSKKLHEQAL